MHLDALFSQFIREKQFLNNTSPRTIKTFRDCQRAYYRTVGDELPTKENIKQFVIKLQESGISISTVNYYIRTLNSFLSWMFENDMLEEWLRLKRLKEPERTLKTFSDDQLRALLDWKPKTFFDWRLYTMVCLAIDTGVRIDEMITLTRDRLNLEQLMVTVRGKGNKERVLPISIECKRILQKFLRKHDFNVVFPTRHGGKLYYFNTLRNFKELCNKVGITGVRTSWHTLRHSFATSYIRDGGNVFYLQRVLGHTDLTTTKIYVRSQTEDLQLMHKKTSLMSKLK